MTRERWQKLEELYQAALVLPPAERSALLERADPELRATIVSILAQENTAPGVGSSLDRPACEGRESLLDTGTIVTVGKQLGPYRVEERIGQGGMEIGRAHV